MQIVSYILIGLGVAGLLFLHEILAAIKNQQGYQRSREGRVRRTVGKVLR